MAVGANTGVGWKDFFITTFVLAIGYVVGFELVKNKWSWLFAAGTCVVAADILTAIAMYKTGFYLPTFALTSVEWLTATLIAGILTVLVPVGSDDPKPKKPLY